jgi:hypothetical protein
MGNKRMLDITNSLQQNVDAQRRRKGLQVHLYHQDGFGWGKANVLTKVSLSWNAEDILGNIAMNEHITSLRSSNHAVGYAGVGTANPEYLSTAVVSRAIHDSGDDRTFGACPNEVSLKKDWFCPEAHASLASRSLVTISLWLVFGELLESTHPQSA